MSVSPQATLLFNRINIPYLPICPFHALLSSVQAEVYTCLYFCTYNSSVKQFFVLPYTLSDISYPTTFCHFRFISIAKPHIGIPELQNIMQRLSVIADSFHIESVNSSAVEIKCRAYKKSKSAPMSAKPTLTKSPSTYRNGDIWYMIDCYRAQPEPNTLLLATMGADILCRSIFIGFWPQLPSSRAYRGGRLPI